MAESVLLQSCFQLLPGKKLFEVRLTRKKLVYEQTTVACCKPTKLSLFSTNIEDIYGAKVFKRNTKDDVNAYLHIFTCPLEDKKRVRKRIRFKVSGWEDIQSNVRLAGQWVKTISWLVKDPDIDANTIKGNHFFLAMTIHHFICCIINIDNFIIVYFHLFFNNIEPGCPIHNNCHHYHHRILILIITTMIVFILFYSSFC